MTIQEALTAGTARLAASRIETPALDAALLLADILNTTRTGLALAAPNPLPEAAYRRFTQSLDRRLAGECVAYILGHKEFRGLDFAVTPDVLVPRPDTETLVEVALAHIDRLQFGDSGLLSPAPINPGPASLTVLDLCTGSGVMAISLKHERPGLAVFASDISPKALAIARLNAQRLLGAQLLAVRLLDALSFDVRLLPQTVNEKPIPASSVASHDTPATVTISPAPITFIESDLFDGFAIFDESDNSPQIPRRFSLIVSNPPYVPTAAIGGLSPEVQGEPRLALDGGTDGLTLIRRIITDARERLLPGGMLLLEADPTQMETITRILESRGYIAIQTYMDLTRRPRVIGGMVST
ncbi:release factor glutamine methyltransferase [Spirochaetia bacterium]|nr:release factor glutamine methyltransferase [Spirochaetia bacterium]